MKWIADEIDSGRRGWEEFYRSRWQYDKTVRSTHGVNCTGGCSWMVYVKDGIITWELQALDYPKLDQSLPPYEPRGCQRGACASWYVYSPLRIKYPYVRGSLIDLWRDAKKSHPDPVDAWRSIVENDESRKKYTVARGKGGFRRFTWEQAAEIIVAAQIYTIKKYGPDRNISFSPIPAMSMVSYAGGARYHQLIGGVSMSFYDYYTDLPPASFEVWGEQTDVSESADWYHAGYTVIMGANLNMTRTPDLHFTSENRIGGGKLVVLSPDWSMVSKYADLFVPLNPGTDGALWVAVNHVILKEFFADRTVPYFDNYVKNFTDLPYLVKLQPGKEGGLEPGRFLKASDLEETAAEDNADWKLLMFDETTKTLKLPNGSIGYRHPNVEKDHGKWNALLQDGRDGSPINPSLSLIKESEDTLQVDFWELDTGETYKRGVPVRYVQTKDGRVPVTTVFDLMMGQHGVSRGLTGDYPASYDDEGAYTPAWQEKYTGIGRETIIQIAREFAGNAESTEGRSMVIVGAGVNHWFHSNLTYRAMINALMLCGCEGRNGGGMNHYVGQERLAPFESWGQVAFGLDWARPARQMNTPSLWYFHTNMFKYDSAVTDYDVVPGHDVTRVDYQHTADYNVRAVRMGWLPCYPQWNKSSIDVATEAVANGAKNDQEIVDHTVAQLKSGELDFTLADPEAPQNYPRVWMIWRGNALGTSARGQEYFLKHLLGTHNTVLADEVARDKLTEVVYRESVNGKLDLVVDLNMRMNTTPTYSDIVLPAAHWYEKEDINTTDMHSYIVPLGAAVPPNWEAKSDWDAFKFLAMKFQELAKNHFPQPIKEVVSFPLMHDTPNEIAQPEVKDWKKGECEAIPGKTMPNLAVVERDYANVYNRFVSFGPLMKTKYGFHGIMLDGAELYDEYAAKEHTPLVSWDEKEFISLEEAKSVANVIMNFSGLTNGEIAYRQFKIEEHHTGIKGLADKLAGPTRGVRMTYDDIVAQPRRWMTSPLWSGNVNEGRSYTAWILQVEDRLPWRTLSGKQHFYVDHPIYLDFGEGLAVYKHRLPISKMNELEKADTEGALQLQYLTPHGKWSIHSTFYDNLHMLTLSRGGNTFWLNDKDAASVDIRDNDWVEVYNDNGVYVSRAIVSARIPKGSGIAYHSTERTINVPKAQQRGNRRGGYHNSLTRQRLKPNLMTGGYAQLSYAFNAHGPIPQNRDTTILVRKMKNQEVKW